MEREKILECLKIARQDLATSTRYKGICGCLKQAMQKLEFPLDERQLFVYRQILAFIPAFRPEVFGVTTFFSMDDTLYPSYSPIAYWWPVNEEGKLERLKVLDKLIELYK